MPSENLIRFAQGLQSSYDSLTASQINANTLYYCTDSRRLFLGDKEYSRPIVIGNTTPNSPRDYPPYSLYFNNNANSGGTLYYNDGSNWHEIYNLTSISNQFNRRAELLRGTCSTAAATTVKNVICPDFLVTDFSVGTLMAITFSNTNTGAVANLKMTINGTSKAANNAGDPIKQHYGESVSNLAKPGELRANQTYLFAFDGTNWVCLTLDYNTNTNTYVTQSILNTDTNHPLLMSYYANDSSTTTAQIAYRNDKIYANPSTGTLTATTFNGPLQHSLTIGNIVFNGSQDIDVPVYDGSITQSSTAS